MRSLLLGLDVSPRRMGWGLVDLVSGEPVACGCEAIELPPSDKHPERTPWDRERVNQALRTLLPYGRCATCHGSGQLMTSWGTADHGGGSVGPCPKCSGGAVAEIQAAYIEHPISRFPGMAYDEGRAVGMVHCEVQRRWPHAPVEYLKPSEWRVLAGLKGNASKADVLIAAEQSIGRLINEGQDAADALLIAVAGQRRNGETWDRAVERGDTEEAA